MAGVGTDLGVGVDFHGGWSLLGRSGAWRVAGFRGGLVEWPQAVLAALGTSLGVGVDFLGGWSLLGRSGTWRVAGFR